MPPVRILADRMMLLEHPVCLVQERLRLLKAADHYDLFDPVTGDQIGQAREILGRFVGMLRMLFVRHVLPTAVVVEAAEGSPPLLTLRRGLSLLLTRVAVLDGSGNVVGSIRRHRLSIGGKCTIHSPDNQLLAVVVGHWRHADFTIQDPAGQILGTVNAPWTGPLHARFHPADHYLIVRNESVTEPALATLVLAAGLALEIIFKERG